MPQVLVKSNHDIFYIFRDVFPFTCPMAKVKLTSALKRFFPTLSDLHVTANNVREVLFELEQKHPGINHYLVDDQGHLRQHVNIFVKGELIKDRKSLTDSLSSKDEVVIFQALSGG
ncbi:MAG: MoaD/ThiS family protein [Cyclobacteriaceae bacterium]